MASADFCPITATITRRRATAFVSLATLFARPQPVACRDARIILLSSDSHCFCETSAIACQTDLPRACPGLDPG